MTTIAKLKLRRCTARDADLRAENVAITARVTGHGKPAEFAVHSLSAGDAVLLGHVAPSLAEGDTVNLAMEVEGFSIELTVEIVGVAISADRLDKLEVAFHEVPRPTHDLIERLVIRTLESQRAAPVAEIDDVTAQYERRERGFD